MEGRKNMALSQMNQAPGSQEEPFCRKIDFGIDVDIHTHSLHNVVFSMLSAGRYQSREETHHDPWHSLRKDEAEANIR